MEYFKIFLLVVHIIGGYVALSVGGIILLLQKGNTLHQKLGRIFYAAMMAVVVSALVLAPLRPSWFLFHIGVFVGYQTWAGYRSVKDKSLRPNRADYIIFISAIINGIWMLQYMQVVLMVFGGISLILSAIDVVRNVKLWKGKPLPVKDWLARHIGMMMGAYIGAFTAFLVVNITTMQPPWVLWLAPTIVLVPLLAYWQRKYA
jgi:uncharacterized membrane protein